MKSRKILIFILFFGAAFALGCDGCYDNELNNYVNPPQFSHVRGTNYLIEMTCPTSGSSVKYTVDGSDPKTSSSAVQGTSVTIDFFTEIKAYAFKDGMLDSKTACYRIPSVSRTTYIKYKANGNIHYHSYTELDGNENKVIEAVFIAKGGDSTWLTDDDTLSQYTLYLYDETGLIQETVFADPGADNEWLTPDDGIASYCTYENTSGKPVKSSAYSTTDELLSYRTYEYSGGNLSFMRQFDADDNLTAKKGYSYNGDGTISVLSDYDPANEATVLSHINYSYSAGRAETSEEISDTSGETISYSTYHYDNIEEYSLCQYDSNDNLTDLTRYKGYGTDTGFELTEYTYDAGGNRLTKTEYSDVNKTECKLYTEYSYGSGSLQGEVYYSNTLKDEKLYSYNYSYTSGNLSRKEKIDSDDTTLLEYTDYEYDGDSKKIKETTYIQPDPGSLTISFNLEISAGYIDGGYYAAGGASFSQEGDPVNDIIEIDPDLASFIHSVVGKLESVYNNLEITNNGIIITGTKAGNIVITAGVTDNVITVKYSFNGYDDGDIIVTGQVLKTLQGTIDLNGNLSGSLNGTLTGSLAVTDADPSWTAGNFLQSSYSTYEYNGTSGLLEKTKYYADPGPDGEWGNADDNLTLLTVYSYDASDYLAMEQVFSGPGADETWETGDDVQDYHLDYSYSGTNAERMEKYMEYGTYVKCYTDAGADIDWYAVDDNVLGYSFLEFSETE